MVSAIVLEPTAMGIQEVSIELGRLEAGKVHEITVEVENPTEHDYQVTEITSKSEKVDILLTPKEIKGKEKGTIILSLDIPMEMEPLEADLRIDGIFIIRSK